MNIRPSIAWSSAGAALGAGMVSNCRRLGCGHSGAAEVAVVGGVAASGLAASQRGWRGLVGAMVCFPVAQTVAATLDGVPITFNQSDLEDNLKLAAVAGGAWLAVKLTGRALRRWF